MRRIRSGALLAELHAHTTWSDGVLSAPALIDLYGTPGFEVLCGTDHVCRSGAPGAGAPKAVKAETFAAYRTELEREAPRAWQQYGLLVVPGLELVQRRGPRLSAHALALGLRSFVPLDSASTRRSNWPSRPARRSSPRTHLTTSPSPTPGRLTQRFARDPELSARVHRFELFNRTQLFSWVARAGLPCVASGDFHRLEHLSGWKSPPLRP